MEWFYAQGDDRIGPVDNDALSQAVHSGVIGADTLVWCEGMTDWKPYATVPNAVAAVGDAVPAGAVGGAPVSAAAPAVAAPAAVASNPYAAPAANLSGISPLHADDFELAGRGDRLAATMIDGLLGVVLVIPMFIAIGAGAAGGGEPNQGLMLSMFGVMAVLGIGLMIFQITLIVKHSATFGKKMMKLYIADETGQPASAGKIIGLRMIVNGIIGALPFVGGFYSIADILCIFREDRRCLHDMIAGTRVLKRS